MVSKLIRTVIDMFYLYHFPTYHRYNLVSTNDFKSIMRISISFIHLFIVQMKKKLLSNNDSKFILKYITCYHFVYGSVLNAICSLSVVLNKRDKQMSVIFPNSYKKHYMLSFCLLKYSK